MLSEKSCPFCRSTNVSVSEYGRSLDTQFHVHCNECQADGPIANTKAEAITLWNDRHEPARSRVGDRPH